MPLYLSCLGIEISQKGHIENIFIRPFSKNIGPAISRDKMNVSKANPNYGTRDNQEANPNRKCLVFRSLSTVNVIKQLFVLVLYCPSSDVALGGRARESAAFDHDDVFGGGDAFMDITARVELPRLPNDILLELLGVHGTLLRSLDEQGRRCSTVPNDDTLENKFTAHSTNVILDRPDMVNDKRL